MAPFSKNPITFRWKQVIQYMTSVTCDSVEKITVPNLTQIRYQNDLICVARTRGSPLSLIRSKHNIYNISEKLSNFITSVHKTLSQFLREKCSSLHTNLSSMAITRYKLKQPRESFFIVYGWQQYYIS